jgi:hypothetical protein
VLRSLVFDSAGGGSVGIALGWKWVVLLGRWVWTWYTRRVEMRKRLKV